MIERLILYGSGKRCRQMIGLLENSHISVSAIVDSDHSKWGQDCCGFHVESPECLDGMKNTGICVTFYSAKQYEPVWDTLNKKYGIPKENIYTFHDILLELYKKRRQGYRSTITVKNDLPPRILFDASWGLGLGGVESWLKDVISGFDDNQEEDIFLLTAAGQPEVSSKVAYYIKEFYYPDAFSFTGKNVEKGIKLLASQLPCKVVMSSVDELLLAACILKEKYPRELEIIMTVHNSCDGMYTDILSYRKGIDKYVCVSTGMRNDLVSKGIRQERIYVMTCPIVSDAFVCEDVSKTGKIIRIGYAGRLDVFQKRADLLLCLLEELEKYNLEYIFNIAGTGNAFEDIQSYIQERKLEDKVVMHGQIAKEKMIEFWSHQDIAVNISDFEGRPISVMEAMVSGAVPVVTDTVGVLDDVHDGMNGYVIPVGDYRTMADRIIYLDGHRDELIRMKKAANIEMLSKCSLENHMKLWAEVLQRNRGKD